MQKCIGLSSSTKANEIWVIIYIKVALSDYFDLEICYSWYHSEHEYIHTVMGRKLNTPYAKK